MLEQRTADLITKEPRSARRYLVLVLAAILCFVASLLFLGFYRLEDISQRDHFGQIDLNGDRRWYMSFANLATQEMQDRDIIYHGIGASVENLRSADIVLLGHSVLQYAVDNALVETFERKHGVKVYNLNNPGIASGQYVKQIIEKWHLKPKIWVINADDYPGDFFSLEPDDHFSSGRNSVESIAKTSYFQSYLNVASRGIRWRLEMAVAQYGPAWLTNPPYPFLKAAAKSWRNIENGNFYPDEANNYQPPENGLPREREGACRLVSESTIKAARNYIADIGGSVLLTLVPYYDWCPKRIPELASRLGVESFLPSDARFPLQDGRHMNRTGAVAYTKFMLRAIEDSYSFKKMVGDANPGIPPGEPVEFPSLPVDVCVSNNNRERLFVSVRSERGNSDHAMEAGARLRVAGLTDGQLCSDTTPFNGNQCPNARYQAVAKCE